MHLFIQLATFAAIATAIVIHGIILRRRLDR